MALSLGLAVGGCATPTASPLPIEPASPAGSTPAVVPSPTCSTEAAEMSLRQQAGQLVMIGIAGSLDATERKALVQSKAGAVILMGNSYASVTKTRALTTALQRAGGGHLLIATDQEGGLVRRLRGAGFPTMPSAAQQAKLSATALQAQAATWAKPMAKAGVLLDLAPVADVVPKANRSSNRPVAQLGRGFGSDPESVSAKVAAFRAGFRQAGVATAVKHFPGLGAVRGNTDFSSGVVDDLTDQDSELLLPFRDAVATDADAIMVSSAIYGRIDSKNPAVFSSTVIGMLREWGYDGVVISDDLGVAVAVRKVSARSRASRFVAAGGDLAITVDPRLAGSFTTGLVNKAKADDGFAARLEASTARVLRLKQSLGLIECR